MYRNRCCGSGVRLRGSPLQSEHNSGNALIAAFRGRKDAVSHPPQYTPFCRGCQVGAKTQLAFWGNPQNTIELSEGELRPLRSALCCCAASNGKEKMTGFAALPFFFFRCDFRADLRPRLWKFSGLCRKSHRTLVRAVTCCNPDRAAAL